MSSSTARPDRNDFAALLGSVEFFCIVVLNIFVIFVAFLFIKPVYTAKLISRPNPVLSYKQSVERIEHLRSFDGQDIAPDGHLIFLTHGSKTSHVIVFFHGSTNSPRQFSELAKIFYEKGYNVLVPRLPHHGLQDRMTEEHAKLTAEELIKLCDEAMDIAQGLGEHVTVVGLSLGANMTSWVAQNRSDVDKAVIITPFWGWKGLPADFFKPSINLLSILPNMTLWWNKEEKMAFLGPTSTYYRFSTRGLAQIMRLGWRVNKEARHVAPKTRSIVVVTNALDDAVNERNIDKVASRWQKYPGIHVTQFKFDRSFGVYHDLIDPQQPYQKTAVVYPKLIDLIENSP